MKYDVSSVYIHIPFCSHICSYCDFSKILYFEKYASLYLDALEYEIDNKYKKNMIKTIYIGGGTPSSLSLKLLKKLMKIVSKFNFDFSSLEFTFECNIESITFEKLKILRENNVNRLSIGVQSFQEKNLKFLNRYHNKSDVFSKIKLIKEMGFENINIDLIYAIPGESIDDLVLDLNEFLKLKINHISTYSLMIEPHTKLHIDSVKPIAEDLDYMMYRKICEILKSNGYNQYEISNFCKDGFESRHNLNYWNNNQYYGFGLGASGYIGDIRYKNNCNISKYLELNFDNEYEKISEKLKIEYEFILGLRKREGIKKSEFYKKYHINLKDIRVVSNLLNDGKLIETFDSIIIPDEYIYTSNDILMEFVEV